MFLTTGMYGATPTDFDLISASMRSTVLDLPLFIKYGSDQRIVQLRLKHGGTLL